MSDHIDVGLHRLEVAFKRQDPERLRLFSDVLRKKRITETEMGEAVIACVEFCKFFPSVREILTKARPVGLNLPPSDAGPVWDPPKTTPMQRARDERANLSKCLDVYRRQNRPAHTLAAVERDIAKIDREIIDHETLAAATVGMSEEDAGQYAIRFWGGERHLPNVMAMLAAKDSDRNLRGPELWQGQL